MNLLVVMANYPFPPGTGSAIVAYNSLRILSRLHNIELASLSSTAAIDEAPDMIELAETRVAVKYSKLSKLARYLFFAITGVPPSVSSSASKDMCVLVKQKFDSGRFDAVLLFEMSAIQYCPENSFPKLIVNIEDPASIKLQRMADLPVWSFWQKAGLHVLSTVSASYEKKILGKMAKVLLLSEADIVDTKKKFSFGNLAYTPYGVEQIDSSRLIPFESRGNSIIFSGNMFHPPNVDAAIFLLRDIFPLIVEQHPFAKLWIVGANPVKRIFKSAEKYGENVVITGRVDDIAKYIGRSTVSICPVRLKIGVQTKVLEALSWATPVVTTSAGNSGINAESGQHLWVEDSPEMLAKRVCDLLAGQEWSRLSRQGRQFALDKFSWEGSVERLQQQLNSLE